MDEDLLRHGVARGEQHRRPVDAVEPQDVLRHQMPHLGPERVAQILAGPCERERAQIVDERVRPDVGDLPLVPRQGNAPGLARAADREVAEPARDEALHLVEPKRRLHEVRALGVELQQLVLIGRETEEVVLLLDPLGLRVVEGAQSVDQLLLGLEGFAADAVEAGVHVFVHIAVVVDPLQELADEPLVALVARPNEKVGLGVQARREAAPGLGNLVDVLLSAEALAFSDPPDLRRVLVDAGEEEGLVAALTMMPREDVGRDRGVRVANVRLVVHVVDRRGHVEAHREQ